MGYGSSIVTAEAQVWSLAQELLHAVVTAKKKKKGEAQLAQYSTILAMEFKSKNVNPNIAVQKWQVYMSVYWVLFKIRKIVNNLKVFW